MMSGSQSLDRGLELLEAVNKAERPIGTRELARILDLSPAIVQRLINTLAERHYLRRDPETKRYVIGYQTLAFGASLRHRDQLLIETRRELNEVSRKLRVDSFMASLQGSQAIYLVCVTGVAPITVPVEPGDTLPLHSTAIGKCLLASIPETEALKIIGPGPLPAVTRKTITDPAVLLEDVRLARDRGYAIVRDENIEGMTSVGALIQQSENATASAISLSFSPHFSKDMDVEEAAAVIVAASRRIARAVG